MKKIIVAFVCVIASYAAIASEWVNGEIIRIDIPRNRIMMKHEYIASIKMHAMTMPFGITSGLNVEPYKPGDKVRFQFKIVDGALDITTMEKLK